MAVEKQERISSAPVRPAAPPLPFASDSSMEAAPAYPSSLTKAVHPSSSSYQPTKPVLERPQVAKHLEEQERVKTNPVPHLIQMILRLETLGNKGAQLQTERLEALTTEMRTLSLEEAKKQEEALAISKQIGFWSVLEDIGNMILGGISSVFGYTVATSGAPVAGGMLIAAGVLSITNLVLKRADLWSYLAKEIAGEDEELAKTLLTTLPAAFAIASTILGLAGTYGAWQAGHFSHTTQAMAVLQTTVHLVQAGTALTNARLKSNFHWTQADLSRLQFKGTAAKLHVENAMEEMEEVAEQQAGMMELGSQLVGTTRKGIQITQQVV